MTMSALEQPSERLPEIGELQAASAQLIDRVLRHPFLQGCAEGTVTLDQLQVFLIQHGKYSKYFTRYLCALISQLDESDDVLKLAENLTEELGYGPEAEVRTPHSRIYAAMLKDFGIDILTHETNPETQNLIDTMFMLCRQPRGTAGLGAMCLGAEGLVPAMYARIIQGFQHHGIDLRRLEFFSIHIECDDDHAATMYDILERQSEQSPSSRITALNAGDIAVSARLRFFDALMKRAS
ncbi:TenA family transcriptional regulator [Bradyrhizobium sp. USDA 10063]